MARYHSIVYSPRGALNLIGNEFANVGTITALQLYLDPSSTCSANALGNSIGSTLANPLTSNNAAAVWFSVGNQIVSSGVGTPLPTQIRQATTVANLPSASVIGAGGSGWVTNATATTFLSIVAGGGSNQVPVSSDGTNWLIG